MQGLQVFHYVHNFFPNFSYVEVKKQVRKFFLSHLLLWGKYLICQLDFSLFPHL